MAWLLLFQRPLATIGPASPVFAPPRPVVRGALALDGAFWRRVAFLGASRAPSWFVRWSPPLIGAAIAMAMPAMRRRISLQLATVRGRVSPLRDTIDVLRTYANFASCLTELLSTGSKNAPPPQATIHCGPEVAALLSADRGVIFATAHTAGWESLGALLARQHHKKVMIVMQRERDGRARELQDALRRAEGGVQIQHVGRDPLASLPLMRHLREGGVVALQIDRVPQGMASRHVRLFGRDGVIPEGPLRLAQLTGAPIVSVFSARTGHRRYEIFVNEPVVVARWAEPAAVDEAAQQVADALSAFVRARPTQWFPFND
jgi:lauroyl/myristoyl acyltransferase